MTAPNKMAKRAAAGTLALAVCLTGGIAFAGAAQADANFKFDQRIAGDERIDTAIAASKAVYVNGADNVVLVNGYREVDGLTASYLAGLKDAPILYLDKDGKLGDKTEDELERLKAKNIFLVGGTTVIPASTASALDDDYKVERFGGSDRYETAAEVATAEDRSPEKVFVSNGTRLPDALVVGPVAFAKKYPVLLTEPNSVPDATEDAIDDLDVDEVIVVGGTAVVTDATYRSLEADERLAGEVRSDTAVEVAEWAVAEEGFVVKDIGLVSGTDNNQADSLIAAPLAGKGKFNLLFSLGTTVPEATTKYLKDNAAKLTGKGYVFGGTSAVTASAASAATTAAGGTETTNNQSYTVTDVSSVSSGKFTYADAAAAKGVVATFTATDTFSVDGKKASSGAFGASLSIGDVVSISKTSAGNEYSLTSKDRTKDFTTGVIANVNTTSHTFDIIEPVTGVALNAAPINYTSSFTFYTIDGAQATQAQLELDVNEGDLIAVTGGDGTSADKPRTIALTNRTVSGSIGDTITVDGQFNVQTTAGAKLGNLFSSGTGGVFVLTANDKITFNGATMAVADFDTTHEVTKGDSVTYARKGGVQTVTVADAAPAAISGTVASGATASALSYWVDGGSAPEAPVDVDTGFVLTVDGALVDADEFTAALSAGDQVVIQGAGGSITASVALTNKTLTGKVSNVNGNYITVRNAADTGDLKVVEYTNSSSVYAGNATTKWSINGTEATQAQFTSELSLVANGSKTAVLTATDAGTVVTYNLATAVNATAAAAVSIDAPSSATAITLRFSKPVYFPNTVAAGDFTVTEWSSAANGGAGGYIDLTVTDVSAKTAAGATQSVTLTTSGATTAGRDFFKVVLNAAGAAKFLDASGTPAKASAAAGVTGTAAADSTAPLLSAAVAPANSAAAGTQTIELTFSEPIALKPGTTAAQAGALFEYSAGGTVYAAGSNLVIAANGKTAALTVLTAEAVDASADKIRFTPAGGKGLVDTSTNPSANEMVALAATGGGAVTPSNS